MNRFLIFCSLLLVTGCIVPPAKGFRMGYKRLTESEKTRVLVLSDSASLEGLTFSDTIFFIKANQLKTYLNTQENTVVYFWTPNCSAPTCYPINAVQRVARQKKCKLVVIAEYLDMEQIQLESLDNLDLPLFAVHFQHYGSAIRNTYQKRFINDLFDRAKLEDSVRYSNFFVYQNGTLTNNDFRVE